MVDEALLELVAFESERSRTEFRDHLHPDTCGVVLELAIFLRGMEWDLRNGRPHKLFLTDVRRTKAEQRATWLQSAERWFAALREGREKQLSPKNRQTAKDLLRMTEQERGEWAENKFTWHLEGLDCAVDIRNTEHLLVQGQDLSRRYFPEPLTPEETRRLGVDHQLFLPHSRGVLRQTAIEAWIKRRCEGPKWEVILEDHGTAPHWHIARRDFSRQEQLVRRI